jgi:hypothetical protein
MKESTVILVRAFCCSQLCYVDQRSTESLSTKKSNKSCSWFSHSDVTMKNQPLPKWKNSKSRRRWLGRPEKPKLGDF